SRAHLVPVVPVTCQSSFRWLVVVGRSRSRSFLLARRHCSRRSFFGVIFFHFAKEHFGQIDARLTRPVLVLAGITRLHTSQRCAAGRSSTSDPNARWKSASTEVASPRCRSSSCNHTPGGTPEPGAGTARCSRNRSPRKRTTSRRLPTECPHTSLARPSSI